MHRLLERFSSFGTAARRRHTGRNRQFKRPVHGFSRFRMNRLEQLEKRTLLSIGGTGLDDELLWASPRIDPIWFPDVTPALKADFLSGSTTVDLLDNSPQGISGRLSMPGVLLGAVSTNGSDFTRLEVPGWGYTGEVGHAGLPVFRTSFIIPDDMEVVAEYEAGNIASLGDGHLVYPVQAPLPDVMDEDGLASVPEFSFDADYYSGAVIAKSSVLSVSEPAIARGTSVVFVEMSPFQYDPVLGEIGVVTDLTFSLDFVAAEGDDGGEFPLAASLDLVSDAADADYLIITADDFADEVQPLAEWKHLKGFKTYVAQMSTIGTTSADVLSYISSAYHMGTQLEYVLLVGDHDDVPSNDIGTYISDHPYACVDGTDYLPDLTLGRLSVNTDAEATTVVNKILTYDRNPDMGDWYDDALIAGFFQDTQTQDDQGSITSFTADHYADRWFMETSIHVHDYLENDQSMTVHTALCADQSLGSPYYYRNHSYPHRISVSGSSPYPVPGDVTALWTSASQSTADVSAAINSGVSIVQHRDHGDETKWGDPPFSVGNVNALSNAEKTPVVFSTNCSTGTFDYSGGDCFAEAFLKHSNGGAVGIVAATRTSYSGHNDLLVHGTYTSFWPDYDSTHAATLYPHSMRPAEAMNFGKYYMSTYEGLGSTTEIAFNEFHWFGDPEMMLRTATPATLTIIHDAAIPVEVATDVTVEVSDTGSPIEEALVCISKSGTDDYWVGATDSAGSVTFTGLTASELGDYDIVVTAYNVVPYEGTISSIVEGPFGDLYTPAAGSATNVDIGYVEIEWTDFSGSGLNTATIDQNDITIPGLTIQPPAHQAGDVWRYSYTGSLTAGTVEVTIVVDEVQDNAGDWNIGRVVSFVYDVDAPTGALDDPAASTVIYDDPGYVDILWSDVGLAGLDATTLDANDITVTGVTIDGTPTDRGGGVYQYTYTGNLPSGTVIVTFVAAEVADLAGNANVGHAETFTYAPLEITTAATLPQAAVFVPYSTTLEVQGGVIPYVWSLGSDQYVESDPGSGYMGGGVAKNWRSDDKSWELTLPWAFPFYGTDYTSVNVCSNGFLDFASTSTDYSNSQSELLSNIRIAPLWDDLCTNGSGEDIYVTETADHVIVRWDGSTYSGGVDVDFEVVLYPSGNVQFNYGQSHSGLTPTIGVSAGDSTDYTMSSRNGDTSIPNDVSSLFTDNMLPEGLSLDSSTGVISGTPTETETGTFEFTVVVTDSYVPEHRVSKEFSLEVMDLPPLTVDVPDSATEGDGILSGQGTVSIPAALEFDLVVNLLSDDTSEATVPTTATIFADYTSATFDVTIQDDSELDGSQAAAISASATEYVSGSDTITVHDNETATLTVALPASATEGDGVLVDQGTVTVSQAPTVDVAVELSSDDSTEVTVPATVMIPAGQTSATFDVTIIDDTEIDNGTQTAAVTAHVENWTDGSDSIDVLDNDAYLTVQLPADAWENAGTLYNAGTVTIGGTLPSNLTVSLSSDDTSELEVPAMATIFAGDTEAKFNLTVVNDPDQDGVQTVTVTGSATGLSGDSESMLVRDDELHHFSFDPITSPQTASEPFGVTIEAEDVNGDTIVPYTGTVDLSGSGDGGAVTVDPTTTGAFAGGVWTGDVTVHAIDTNVMLTADDGLGCSGTSDFFNVTHGALDSFQWSTISSPQYVDSPFSTTLTAVDAHGYTVTDFVGTVDLSGWTGSGETILFQDDFEDANYDGWTAGFGAYTREVTDETAAAGDYSFSMTGGSSSHSDGVWRSFADLTPDRVDFSVRSDSTNSSNGYFIAGQGGNDAAIWFYMKNDGMMGPYNGTFYGYPYVADQWYDISFTIDWGAKEVDYYVDDSLVDADIPFRNTSIDGITRADLYNYNYSQAWWDKIEFSVGGGANLVSIVPTTAGSFVGGVWTGYVTVQEEVTDMYLRADDGSGHVADSNTFDVQASPADFGDAPTSAQSGFAGSYPTTIADSGARHFATGPTLGVNRDIEADGQPTANANGDDTNGTPDDEDGVTFDSCTLWASTTAANTAASVDIDLQDADASSNRLDAWIDFNQDGDWDDAGEQIFTNYDLGTTNGTQTLTFTIPQDTGANVELGNTYARFRLSTAGGLLPTGAASDGEVEDYLVSIILPTPVLDPEPATTPGTENTIYWSVVTDADEYFAEYDNDSNFSSPEGDSGWITVTEHTFTGLTVGTEYHYRVKARQVIPGMTDSWTQTTQADFEDSGNTLVDVSTTTIPGDVVLAGGSAAQLSSDFESGELSPWVPLNMSSSPGPYQIHTFDVSGDGQSSFAFRIAPNVGDPDGITQDVFLESGVAYNVEVDIAESNENTVTNGGVGWVRILIGGVEVDGFSFYNSMGDIPGGQTFRSTLQGIYTPATTGTYPVTLTFQRPWNETDYIWAYADDVSITGPGGYFSLGSIVSTPIVAGSFEGWDTLTFNMATPTNTSLTVDVLPATGSTPISGYENVSSGADLSGITDTTIRLRANLATTNTSVTPALHDWTVGWQEPDTYVESCWSGSEWSRQNTAPIPGDANLDNVVNDQDASILAAHWQDIGATWADGDFNGDGVVNDQDASILAAHWQETAEGEGSVPVEEEEVAMEEPAAPSAEPEGDEHRGGRHALRPLGGPNGTTGDPAEEIDARGGLKHRMVPRIAKRSGGQQPLDSLSLFASSSRVESPPVKLGLEDLHDRARDSHKSRDAAPLLGSEDLARRHLFSSHNLAPRATWKELDDIGRHLAWAHAFQQTSTTRDSTDHDNRHHRAVDKIMALYEE